MFSAAAEYCQVMRDALTLKEGGAVGGVAMIKNQARRRGPDFDMKKNQPLGTNGGPLRPLDHPADDTGGRSLRVFRAGHAVQPALDTANIAKVP